MSDKPAPVEPTQAPRPAATAPALQATQPSVEQAVATPTLALHPGGRPIAEYELVARLGSGGFGEVWKARGPGGFHVALKIVHLHDEEGVESELRALELMKEIRHPNVLAPFGAWKLDHHVIIAMELGDRTLLDRFNSAKKDGLPGIPRPELLEYLRDGARGIDHLNSLGIQHRDVKPQNFLLVGGGLKVADFGLAKLLQHNVSGHSGGMTPAYAAPEFLHGQTTARSDQYSLAVSYCLLRGGKLPFSGAQGQIMLGHLADAPDLSMLPEVERPIVARALAKKPDERWPSCRAFIEALGGTPEQAVPIESVPVVGPVTQPPPTIVQPRPAVSTMLADWPRPAQAPGPGLFAVFLALALCPFLVLFWPWRGGAGDDPRATNRADGSDSAARLPAKLTNSVGMELVRITPGTFRMGDDKLSAGRPDAQPAHEVTLTRPYYLGKFEVTQRQYEKIMGSNPSRFQGETGGPEHPVESVSWDDAVAFCERLSALPDESKAGRAYRLPTEAEWEYACRAGGDAATVSDDCHHQHDLGPASPLTNVAYLGRTKPVGQHPANAWGLHDLCGNVWEWCGDWSAAYDGEGNPVQNPRGPSHGLGRVLRGGAWNCRARSCAATTRFSLAPASRSADVGFRVAMSVTGR